MAGIDHSARAERNRQGAGDAPRGTRAGHVLFGFYLMLYGGYVLLTAFAPDVMRRTPLAGVNLSVLYGLGLIATAFVLAVLYDWLCRATPGGDGTSAREVRQ